MPSIMAKFLYPLIRNVQTSAGSHSGFCTWQFSQMQDPVASLIAAYPSSADGICEMLAAKWIEGHANDEHIAVWITKGDSIDANKIRYLMQLFSIGTDMGPSAIVGQVNRGEGPNQDQATDNWLAAKGIVRRHGIVPVPLLGGGRATVPLGTHRRGTDREGGSRSVHATNVAQAIAKNLHNGNGHYVKIGLHGNGGAHAMAAWIANDAAFFDPNFGEFYFPRKADFIAWFPGFMRRSLYTLPMFGLCEQYETCFYGKRVI